MLLNMAHDLTPIATLGSCKLCGRPVEGRPANGEAIERFPGWDYYALCINGSCQNHAGEGYFQFPPEWVTLGPLAL